MLSKEVKKEWRSLMRMGKRAVAGLDFLKGFAIALFIVIIVLFLLAIVGANLKDSTTDATAQALITNFTTGLSAFGNSISTWLVLAGLVVTISIVVVVIVVVSRINTSNGGNL